MHTCISWLALRKRRCSYGSLFRDSIAVAANLKKKEALIYKSNPPVVNFDIDRPDELPVAVRHVFAKGEGGQSFELNREAVPVDSETFQASSSLKKKKRSLLGSKKTRRLSTHS